MKRDHLSCKYIKEEEEDKIGTLVKGTIRIETDQVIGQIVEIEDSFETDSGLRRITGEAISKITPEDMVDKTAEGDIEITVIDVSLQ